MAMEPDDVVLGGRYEYKGNTYLVTRLENLKVKDNNDSNWYLAVAYTVASPNHGDVDTYVRRLTDFCQKFTRVDDTEE